MDVVGLEADRLEDAERLGQDDLADAVAGHRDNCPSGHVVCLAAANPRLARTRRARPTRRAGCNRRRRRAAGFWALSELKISVTLARMRSTISESKPRATQRSVVASSDASSTSGFLLFSRSEYISREQASSRKALSAGTSAILSIVRISYSILPMMREWPGPRV